MARCQRFGWVGALLILVDAKRRQLILGHVLLPLLKPRLATWGLKEKVFVARDHGLGSFWVERLIPLSCHN